MLLPFIPKEQMLNGTALKQNTKRQLEEIRFLRETRITFTSSLDSKVIGCVKND